MWLCKDKLKGKEAHFRLSSASQSTRVFETRTATGREYFARQDNGIPLDFLLIVSNGKKIIGNVNVVV